MFRVLTILAAIVALAVSAAPASARGNQQGITLAHEGLCCRYVIAKPQPRGTMSGEHINDVTLAKAKVPRRGVKGFTVDMATEKLTV